MLDKMSVREQRKIVCERADEIINNKNKLIFNNTQPLTKPIDTDLLFLHRIRMTPGEGRRFGVLPKPAVFTFGPLDYQLTMTRDGDAAMLVRSVRLRPGVVEPALYADWIRLLAAIDQREEQRIEILDARSAEPAPK